MRLRWLLLTLLLSVLAIPVIGAAALWSLDSDVVRGLLADQVERATGRRLEVAGELKVVPALRPTLAAEGIALANAAWSDRAEMVTVERLELQLDLISLLRGAPEVQRVLLRRPTLLLETSPDGRGNWQLGGSSPVIEAETPKTPSAGRSSSTPAIAQLLIEDATLVYRGHPVGAETVLRIERAQVGAPEAAGALTVELRGRLDAAPLALAGTASPAQALRTGEPLRLDLKGGLAGLEVGLEGVVTRSREPAFEGAVTLAATDLSGIAALLGQADRLATLAPLTFRARIDGTQERVVLGDLALQLAGSDLAGEMVLEPAAAPPRAEARLRAQLLDLDRLLADASAASALPAVPAEGPLLSREPLPLEPLRELAGRLDLEVAELRHGTLPLREVGLAAVLAEGALLVDPMAARTAGGPVTGRLGLNVAGSAPELDLDLAAQGLELGRVVAGPTLAAALEVAGNLRVELASEGVSPHELASRLRGRVSLLTGAGGVRLDRLDRLPVPLRELLAAALGSGSVAALRCLALDVPVERGLARPGLVLKAGAAGLIGGGTVDLGRERLDLTLSPRARVVGLQLGIPVKIEGALASPSFRVDPAGATQAALSLLGQQLLPPEIAGARAGPQASSASPCLAAPAGPTASGERADPSKALDAARRSLERVGRGALEGLLRDR